jgi:hypothetical protein
MRASPFGCAEEEEDEEEEEDNAVEEDDEKDDEEDDARRLTASHRAHSKRSGSVSMVALFTNKTAQHMISKDSTRRETSSAFRTHSTPCVPNFCTNHTAP